MKFLKTLSCRWAALVLGFGLFLSSGQSSRATIFVGTTNSFGGVTIDPSSGNIDFTSAWQTSAYAQAGPNGDYSAASPSVASALDMPVPGGLATGAALASLGPDGSASATGFIPGATPGFDTSTGQASASGIFEILGAPGPVNVTFSASISEGLGLYSDVYGVYGRGESVFSLSLDGTPTLFNDTLLTIGPSQMENEAFSETLSSTMTLMADTPYYLYAQSDAEAEVINGGRAAPDSMQGPVMAGCLAGMVLLLLRIKWRAIAVLLAAAAVPVHATYIGSDAADPCPTCAKKANRVGAGAASTSVADGNSQQTYPVVTVQSGYGATLDFGLTYNSYNADGSKAQLDLGLGFGWTHNYNSMLFQQRGQMFRLGLDGRVTQYFMNYSSPGNYTSDTGYFETMTQQPDGSFYVTNKYQSWWHYGSVSNSPYLIQGPVYQLLQMGDRNHNVTSMTYDSSGELSAVTDPFGRTLQFTYDTSNHLSTVTDPLGRVTQFQYDARDRELMQITDPLGNTVQYTYNAQDQLTRKVDRDGRMYFYTYKNLEPFMVTDGSGDPYFSMTNPTNWSYNTTDLSLYLRRSDNPSTTSLTDGNGHVWQYTYDTNGYLTQSVAPDGSTIKWTYDPGTFQPSSMTDADGHTMHWTYDAQGNRISMTDALGDVTTWTYDPLFNEVTSMTDPLGRVTDWAYDANGNQISMTDPLGNTERWTYDGNGNVLSRTDKDGNTTTNTYNSFGERITTTDPLGNTTQWMYDPVGNVISSTDPLGRITEWTYDGLDRRIGSTNALGGVTSWTYDPAGDVISMTDPNGNITTSQYDDRRRLIETTDPLGGTTQWTYDANDNRITSTNPNGDVTTNAYDVQNRRIQTIDPLGGTTRWTYDPAGNVISTTDPNTNTTQSTYDALNRVIARTNALGGVTRYFYSMVGGPVCCSATPGTSLLTELQDPDGNITFYHYDELNRQVQVLRKNSDTNDVANPTDAATTTAYDPDGNVISVTDPNTNATVWAYDADNRKISMIDAAGDATRWAYDADGNVLATTAPNLNITTNYYDSLNRLIARYDEIGLISSNAYDADGNRISTIDGLGHTTSCTYDGLNRRVTMTDALGQTATTAYDADNNIISTTDRNGRTTTCIYDALDRRTEMTDALGNATTTAYDPDGNIIEVTDANGHTTTFTYDALNRKVAETYPDAPPNSWTNTYDAQGNLIQHIDQIGQVTTYSYSALYYMTNRAYSPSGSVDQFIYDDGGRLLRGVRNGWSDTFSYDGANRLTNTTQNGRVFTYAYDIQGRTQTNTQPSGRALVYAYDARNSLSAIQDGATNPPIVSYIYNDDNLPVTRTYRNGTTAAFAYNSNNWVISLNHSNGPALITGFNYAYDHEGNVLLEQENDYPSNSQTYLYDAVNRLTNYDFGALSGGVIPSPLVARAWSLDPVGNWSNVVSNSAPDPRAYGPANELLTDNGSNYLYDSDGNLTRDNLYNYAYDEENRLTRVQRRADSAVVGQYIYDALSRRVARVTNPAGAASTNYCFYDGPRIMEEQDAGGATTATYTFGIYIDEGITMDRGGQTFYYHQNLERSTRALTGPAGTVAERYAYDAYGYASVLDGSYNPVPPNPWGTPHSAVTNRYLFTGRELDEESGLYFYRARHHDAVKGRFLQRDPLGYREGMNLYEYTKDNPASRLDPSGMKVIWTPWVGFNYDNGLLADARPIQSVGTAKHRVLWECDPAGNVVNFVDTDQSTRSDGILRGPWNLSWVIYGVFREATAGPTTGASSSEANCGDKKGKLIDIWFGVDDARASLTITGGVTAGAVNAGVNVQFPEPSDGLQFHRVYKICCCCGGVAKNTIVTPFDQWIEKKSTGTSFSERNSNDSFPGCISSFSQRSNSLSGTTTVEPDSP